MMLTANFIKHIRKLPRWVLGYYGAVGIALIVVLMTLYSDRQVAQFFNDIVSSDQAWDAWFVSVDSLQTSTVRLLFSAENLIESENFTNGLRSYRIQESDISRQMKKVAGFPRELSADDERHQLVIRIRTATALEESTLAYGNAVLTAGRNSAEASEQAEQGVENRFAKFIDALQETRDAARNYHAAAVKNETNDLLSSRYVDLAVHLLALAALLANAVYGLYLVKRLSLSETQRTHQLQQLAESESRFKSLVANVPGGVFRISGGRENPLSYASEHVHEILRNAGRNCSSPNFDFNDAIVEEDFKDLLQQVARVTPEDDEYEAEYRLAHPDGSQIWIWERGRVSFDEAGQPRAIEGVIFDISERMSLQQALDLSERRLLKITAGLPGIVYQFKIDGAGEMSFPFMSDSTREIFAADLPEIQHDANQVFERINPNDLPRLMESIQHSFTDLTPWGFDFRVNTDHGEKWLRGASLPHKQPDGSVIWNGLLIDISAEKDAEERLRASEERYRFLIENQSEGVAIVDKSEKFTFVNPAASRIFGYSREELTGMSLRDISNEEDYDHHLSEREYFRSSNNHVMQTRILRKDGQQRFIEVTISPHFLDGEFVGTFAVIRDITEQTEAEAALRESEARFQTVFGDLDIGMITVNFDGTIREANRAFCAFVGRPAEEIIGHLALDLSHPDDREMVQSAMMRVLQSKGRQPVHSEHRFVSSDGTTKWGQVWATVFMNESNEPQYIVGMVENITARKQIESRVEESEALYRHLFEGSTDGYLLLAHHVVDCNRQACEILGYSREELIGMNPHEFSPEFQPDGRSSEKAAKELIKRALGGRPQRFFWKHKCKDGTLIDTEIALKLISIRGEKLILAGLRDITERLKQEREIKENLVKIDTLFRAAVDGIVAFDDKGRIELINPAATRIFDCDLANVIGEDFFHFLAEPQATQFRAKLEAAERQQLFFEGISNEELTGIRSGSGDRFPLSLAVNPMQIDDQLKFVAIARDVTDNKIAEQTIRESESKLKAILDSAAEGIIVVNEEGIILNFNKAAERIFGKSASQERNRSINDLIPSLSVTDIAANRLADSYETQGLHDERGEIPLQVSFNTVALDDVVNVTLIVRDKTYENEQRDRMIESDKYLSIGTLAAGIAHEFKNYLAGIIGHASFAKDCLNDADGIDHVSEAFDQIVEIGEKANEVAMSLLTYSRKSSDSQELIDINDLVKATLNFGKSEIRGENITIVEKLESTKKIKANSNHIQQIIFNLLLNARQAMPRAGVMTIVTKDIEGHVILKVGDTGIGIDPGDLKRVFDPFFSTKGVWGDGQVQGTGLGLSISKNILSKLGGGISVKSRIGVGTTFIVKIPAATEIELSGRVPPRLKYLVVASIDSGLHEAMHRLLGTEPVKFYAISDAESFEAKLGTVDMDSVLVIVDMAALHPADSDSILSTLQTLKIRGLVLPDGAGVVPAGSLPVSDQNPPDLETLIAAFETTPAASKLASRAERS